VTDHFKRYSSLYTHALHPSIIHLSRYCDAENGVLIISTDYSTELESSYVIRVTLLLTKAAEFCVCIYIYLNKIATINSPGCLADDRQLHWSPTLAQTTAFHCHEDADCPPNIQLFRGQDLCSCCHKSLEQSAARLTKCGLIILPVQVVAGNIFIWTA